MTKAELLAIARRKGFKRVSHLTKDQLFDLILDDEPIQPRVVGRGIPPAEFSADFDVKMVPDGYLVQGVDLEGLFESTYVPERNGWFVPERHWFEFQHFIDPLIRAARDAWSKARASARK